MKLDFSTIGILLVFGIFILGIIYGFKWIGNLNKNSKKYKRKESFLTKAELVFYKTLKDIIQNQYIIQCKVRLEDLVEPLDKPKTSEYTTARNFIRAMHIDFLLCNTEDLNFICAIELDDSSHFRNSRKEADEKKNKALKDANIPIFRIPTKYKDNKDYIIKTIFQVEEQPPCNQVSPQQISMPMVAQIIPAATDDNSRFIPQ